MGHEEFLFHGRLSFAQLEEMHVRMIWRFQNHTGFTTRRGDRPLVPDGAPGEVKGSRDCHSDGGGGGIVSIC